MKKAAKAIGIAGIVIGALMGALMILILGTLVDWLGNAILAVGAMLYIVFSFALITVAVFVIVIVASVLRVIGLIK